ncbi:MAG: HNH endonuclease [Pseudobdellovibrionaceae bacterium]
MNHFSKRTNTEIESDLKNLVAKERKLLHVILEHINEVEVRKIFLERAYSSMYEYLVKELGYSGSAAMRRLEAARLLKRVPSLSEKIQDGSVNLSQIGEFSKMIKEKERVSGEKISCLQKVELVSMIVGKTTLETQKELSLALDIPIKDHEVQRIQKNDSVRLELTFSKEQYEKLLQCKDLSAHLMHRDHKDSSWVGLIEILCNQFLKTRNMESTKIKQDRQKKNPCPKDEPSRIEGHSNACFNTDNMNTVTNTLTTLNQGDSINKSTTLAEVSIVPNEHKNHLNYKEHKEHKEHKDQKNQLTTNLVTQHINKSMTPKTRREVLNRDRCCQYKDPATGKLCNSTYGLQVDHRHPRWDNGDNSLSNLVVLCMQHNQYKYRKEANIRSF